jgi:hypothetical protein
VTEEKTESERGKRARVDRETGEVRGSGSGAGGGGNPKEDFDMDSVAGAGADPQGGPVPAEQARRGPQDHHHHQGQQE